MALFDFLLRPATRKATAPVRRRRRCVKWEQHTVGGFLGVGGKRKRRCAKYSDSPAVLKKGEDTEQRRETARRERAEAREQAIAGRARRREQQMTTSLALKTERAYKRQKARLRKEGWSDQEADELLQHQYEENPPRLRLALDFLHGGRSHARRNPTCGTCAAAREASEAFHGEPHETARGKVVVGQLEQIGYRAPARSSRAGLWVHEAGDTGIPFMRNRGRARILADPKTGAVSLDTKGSGLRWSRSRGLVG